MVSAVITGFGTALPPVVEQTDLWSGFFAKHFNNNAIAKRMFTTVGVERRHAVANPLIEDVSQWSTEARMQRYGPEALPLATKAVQKALAEAGLAASDVGLLAVASCTGYVTPGVDTFVARDLQMSADVQRLVIGHMGCYAALPGISAVSDYVVARNKPAVLVCVELASLHVQPPTNDVEQIVAHSLFSDAAVAIVVQPEAPIPTPDVILARSAGTHTGFEVVDTAAFTDNEHADLMTWKVTDKGFRMTLGQTIPDVLAKHVRPMVESLMLRNDLTIDDVDAWAAHPGGPRILDVIEQELKLKPDDLAASRTVLREHGNCSSATVLLVLDEVRKTRDLQPGQHVLAIAFGPGLTLYATLLQAN